jgi:hypothetical protein
MIFKLKYYVGGTPYEFDVLDDSFVEKFNTIQHHGMPKVQNKVILRGGLRYDEAWLCLHLPPNEEIGRPPFASGFLVNRLNSSLAVTIRIGNWDTDNWRCLNHWKVACGSKSFWLCHFVDTRYFLCETPDHASLAIKNAPGLTSLPGGGAPYYGSTVEFQRQFGTGSLEKALTTILANNYTPTGAIPKIGNKGTWVTPWTDSSWSALVGYFADINLNDKTTLHFAQYLLDHYSGLLVRNYTGVGSDKNDNDLDIVSWDSGSTPPGPYLCSWDCPKPTGVSEFTKVNFGPLQSIARDAFFNDGHGSLSPGFLTLPPSDNPSLPFVSGRARASYEYCDIDNGPWTTTFRGTFPRSVLYKSLAKHLNRNKEGYVLPNYVAYAPSGKFDTVVYEKSTTTLLRAPIERPEYHPQPISQVYTAFVEGCGIFPGNVGPVIVNHGKMSYSGQGERALCLNVSNEHVPPGWTIVFSTGQNLGATGSSDTGASELPTGHILYNQTPKYITGLRNWTKLPQGDPGVYGVLYWDLVDEVVKQSTGPVEGPADCTTAPYE